MLSRLIERLTHPSRPTDGRAAAPLGHGPRPRPRALEAGVPFAAAQADWTPLPPTATALPDWAHDLAPSPPTSRSAGGPRSLDTAALEHLMRRPEQRIDVAAFIAQQEHGARALTRPRAPWQTKGVPL